MPSAPSLDDIRHVGLPEVEDGSFLITGLPRIRSAWLAALLSSPDGMPIYHEAPSAKHPIVAQQALGLIDPGAACLYPNLALERFGTQRIVIIEREPKDSLAALERLTGEKALGWPALLARYRFFCERASKLDVIVLPFHALDSYDTVSNLSTYLTGDRLTQQRFDLFDGLRVDQDFKKAQAREQAA